MKNFFSPKYNLSAEGLKMVKGKLESLRQERLTQINNLRTLKDQQSDGLSTEDSSYIEAVDKLKIVEAEIKKYSGILAHATVLRSKRQSKRVALGSRVRLKSGNKEVEYTIVQSIEADPSIGKISDESPLGRQLLGKRIRDHISLETLRGKITLFRLVSIS